MKTLLTLFAFLVVFSIGAYGQDVEVSASVVNAISVTTDDDVSFGDVNNNSDATIQAGDDDGGNPNSNAGTAVTGQVTLADVAENQTVIVSWNDDDVVLTDGDGTTISFDPRIFSGLNEAELTTPAGSTIAFGATETTDILYIGGDLASTGIAAGSYSTSSSGGNGITITVDYQ